MRKLLFALWTLISLTLPAVAQFASQISVPPCAYAPCTVQSLTVVGNYTATYTVGPGGTYTSFQSAIDAVNQMVLPASATMAINLALVDGGEDEPSVVNYFPVFGKQINIAAQNNYTTTVTSIQSSSGSAGNYSIVLNVGSVAHFTANKTDAAIAVTSGGTNPAFLAGVWKVTNVDAVNTRITVTSTSRAASAPSGSVIGTINILPTIRFVGTDGFRIWNGGSTLNINGVGLAGDGSAGTRGINLQDLGRVYVNSVFSVRGFGASGNDSCIYLSLLSEMNSDGKIFASGCFNGVIVVTADYDVLNTISTGNANDGLALLAGATAVINDGGTSSVVSGNGNGGVIIDGHSFAKLGAASILNNTGDGVAATNASYFDAGTATSNGNTNHGFTVTSGSQSSTGSATATGNTGANFNGVFFPAGGSQSLTAATPNVAASQVGFGNTTAASSNCNVAVPTPTGCLQINVGGTARYIPYY